MSKPIYDQDALRRYLREQDQADTPAAVHADEAASPAAPAVEPRVWTLVSERETETAIYRRYQSGTTGMEIVTHKATSELPALACCGERPRLSPGNAAAAAAFKQGLEEEYINGMHARYGGEW